MSVSPKIFAAVLGVSGLLVACTSTEAVHYQGLASASQLALNPDDKNGHMPFRYSVADNEWSRFSV